MVLLRLSGDTGAVHEGDLPGACLFFQERRFQPFPVDGAGGVGYAAFIGVGNPSGVTAIFPISHFVVGPANRVLRSGAACQLACYSQSLSSN
jgi:hypothetical protein